MYVNDYIPKNANILSIICFHTYFNLITKYIKHRMILKTPEEKEVTAERGLEMVVLSLCVALRVHLAAECVSCLNAQWSLHCHMH